MSLVGYSSFVITTAKDAREPSLWLELRRALVRVAAPFLLVGTVTVLLGLLVTKVLDGTAFEHGDAALDRTLAAHRTPLGVTLTHIGTMFAETPTIVALTVVAAVALRVAYRRWRESVFLVLCVAGQALIFLVTTLLIDRHRPPVPHLDASPPTSSFPSGHTAAATAFYGGLAIVLAWHTRHRWLRWLLGAFGLLMPVMVAACRMYRGMHYPTDTAASMLMGLALLVITGRLVLFADPAHQRSFPRHSRRRARPTAAGSERAEQPRRGMAVGP